MIDIKELLQQYKISYQSLTFCEAFCLEFAKKYNVNDDRYINKLKRLVELCIIIQMLPLQADRDTEFKIISEEG